MYSLCLDISGLMELRVRVIFTIEPEMSEFFSID
jgi:hypothetical protein